MTIDAWAHVITARTLILRHLIHRQHDSNFLQDFLSFHSFHLQSCIIWFYLGPFQDNLKFDMPSKFHAFEPGVS